MVEGAALEMLFRSNPNASSNLALSANTFSRLIFMFYVYILKLNNGQLYTGYTADLRRRLSEHQAGKSAFTSERLPVELIHYEAYKLESDARRRERFLKSSEGKEMLRRQIRDLLQTFSP